MRHGAVSPETRGVALTLQAGIPWWSNIRCNGKIHGCPVVRIWILRIPLLSSTGAGGTRQHAGFLRACASGGRVCLPCFRRNGDSVQMETVEASKWRRGFCRWRLDHSADIRSPAPYPAWPMTAVFLSNCMEETEGRGLRVSDDHGKSPDRSRTWRWRTGQHCHCNSVYMNLISPMSAYPVVRFAIQRNRRGKNGDQDTGRNKFYGSEDLWRSEEETVMLWDWWWDPYLGEYGKEELAAWTNGFWRNSVADVSCTALRKECYRKAGGGEVRLDRGSRFCKAGSRCGLPLAAYGCGRLPADRQQASRTRGRHFTRREFWQAAIIEGGPDT